MNTQSIDIDKLMPLGRNLLLSKCYNPEPIGVDGKPLIIFPEKTKDSSLWFEILAVGDGCQFFSDDDIGLLVISNVEPGDGNSDMLRVAVLPEDENGNKREIWLVSEYARKDAIAPIEPFVVDPDSDQE